MNWWIIAGWYLVLISLGLHIVYYSTIHQHIFYQNDPYIQTIGQFYSAWQNTGIFYIVRIVPTRYMIPHLICNYLDRMHNNCYQEYTMFSSMICTLLCDIQRSNLPYQLFCCNIVWSFLRICNFVFLKLTGIDLRCSCSFAEARSLLWSLGWSVPLV